MAKVKVDMTGVETFVRCEEGIFNLQCVEADVKPSSKGDDMIVATFEVLNGNSKGAKLYDNFPLGKSGLWKLKQYREALGLKADGKLMIDTDKMIGNQLGAQVVHEEYQGKLKARIDTFLPFQKSGSAAAAGGSDEAGDDEWDEA